MPRRSESLASIAPSNHAPIRRTIKVVLIGDGGCGKTSLRNQFLSGTFSPSYRATIGADFITRTLPMPNGDRVTLQIWDTAGQERFQALGSAFYRGADAVVIAFDLSKEGAEQRIKAWYDAFMDKAPGPKREDERRRFCWICVGNKADLVANPDRGSLRALLDQLVPRPENQPDFGAETSIATPSGAKRPARPEEVLNRPDPNKTKGKATAVYGTPCGSIGPDTLPHGLNITRGDKTVHHKKGHEKRQSIRSIEVFQPVQEPSTPERQRVNSSLSVAASSVYHTPRSSTFLSGTSPTPIPSFAAYSSSDGTTAKSVSSGATLMAPARPRMSTSPKPLSFLANGTQSPPRLEKGFSNRIMPVASSKSRIAFPSSPPPPEAEEVSAAPTTVLNGDPIPFPATNDDEAYFTTREPPQHFTGHEEGFTLFFTSAKTGSNVDRMFRHVVDRVSANWEAQEASLLADDGSAARQEELVRRGIRIADGKPQFPKHGIWACCT